MGPILRLPPCSAYLFAQVKCCFRGERTASHLWMVSGPKGYPSVPINLTCTVQGSAAAHPNHESTVAKEPLHQTTNGVVPKRPTAMKRAKAR